MTGPNRTPGSWLRDSDWKYGTPDPRALDERVPDTSGWPVPPLDPDALFVPEDIVIGEDPPRSGGVIVWIGVALLTAGLVLGYLVTR